MLASFASSAWPCGPRCIHNIELGCSLRSNPQFGPSDLAVYIHTRTRMLASLASSARPFRPRLAVCIYFKRSHPTLHWILGTYVLFDTLLKSLVHTRARPYLPHARRCVSIKFCYLWAGFESHQRMDFF